jgi:hypothetical protein
MKNTELHLYFLFSFSYCIVEKTFLKNFCEGYEPFVGWAAGSGSVTKSSES